MIEPMEFPDREEYTYPRALLRERMQELRALEFRYQGMATPPPDYVSCRRSLLQAIHELRTLLLADPLG